LNIKLHLKSKFLSINYSIVKSFGHIPNSRNRLELVVLIKRDTQ